MPLLQVQSLYGWSTTTIDLLAAWGNIVYLPVSLIVAGLVDRIGLRATITTAAVMELICECCCVLLVTWLCFKLLPAVSERVRVCGA